MRKTLTIEKVEVYKEGESANGPWQLLNVTADGKRYSTFLSVYEGKTYDCEIVSEQSQKINQNTGKPYQNYKITKIYPSGAPATPTKASPAVEELLTLTREIHEMLTDLVGKLAELPDVK